MRIFPENFVTFEQKKMFTNLKNLKEFFFEPDLRFRAVRIFHVNMTTSQGEGGRLGWVLGDTTSSMVTFEEEGEEGSAYC